jgi:hypothetical protein
MNTRKIGSWLTGLLLAAAGCNIGVPAPLTDVEKQAATIVAMTLQAAAPAPTAGGSGTALNTPAAGEVTPGTGPAKFTVPDNTNCRTGPGTSYALVITIPAGTTVQIVARFVGGDYWVVASPDGSGTCWVQGDLGTPTGNFGTLPQVTPAADTAEVPARPGSLFYNYLCAVGTTLSWKDSADNETGYRIYRYDVVIAELPANSTIYTDNTPLALGASVTYGVEAFNSAGPSARRSVSFTCL